MKYNVPVHQSGLYLLCIRPEPSMDPFSTPVEVGNFLVQCSMANLVQVTKRAQSERLNIELDTPL